ncbi:thiaminase II [Neisseriaceae bacterium ESL0693]|nr:thiaminase II [Neisseriaceae bacterium ESL0693]
MKWTSEAIDAIEPVYQQIMAHPFIQQLADGSLSMTKFRYYMEQDALYLAQYRKIMAAIAAKCDDGQHQRQFLHFAAATIEAELAVHRQFLAGIEVSECVAAPNNLLYTGYLYQQLSTQPLAVVVASILPCFYLYQKVGECLHNQSNLTDHPYRIWLAAYADEGFKHDVDTVMGIADELAYAAPQSVRSAMTEGFMTAARMEWLFWDGAWQQQSWPV